MNIMMIIVYLHENYVRITPCLILSLITFNCFFFFFHLTFFFLHSNTTSDVIGQKLNYFKYNARFDWSRDLGIIDFVDVRI